jgi:hypothetical protein
MASRPPMSSPLAPVIERVRAALRRERAARLRGQAAGIRKRERALSYKQSLHGGLFGVASRWDGDREAQRRQAIRSELAALDSADRLDAEADALERPISGVTP